ncbi:hypothetical protein [Methylobacterium sp. CCH5-D2]|uniref:phage neck terminator protein n=1 Tax=Methylobacterium sp. CCH5-D2 TaxID=1768765 RepID=UPI000831DF57|nr:hypothetical protein [Methylobacterium sp. CCH5-D2]
MANTSASGGYLAPVGPQPTQDDAFEDQIQAAIAGITGLPGDLVRPRWQAEPPPQPPADADWAALGVTEVTPDANAYVRHDSRGDGSDHLRRHESVEILVSFYGPNAWGYAARLRDGLAIPQNREALYRANMALADIGKAIAAPALTNGQWVRRIDLSLRVRRQIDRTYSVLNLVAASGVVRTGHAALPFSSQKAQP